MVTVSHAGGRQAHGLRSAPLYNAWNPMKVRWAPGGSADRWYANRGISENWSLDRIDNDRIDDDDD